MKKFVRVVLVVALLGALSFFAFDFSSDKLLAVFDKTPEGSEATTQEVEDTISYGTTLALTDETGVGKSVELILANGGTEFFSGYPVDESFLYWYASEFGKGALCDIAYALYEGNTNPGIWEETTGESFGVTYTRYCEAKQFATYTTEHVVWMDDTEDETTVSVVGDINFADDWYTMQYLNQNDDDLSACIEPAVLQALNDSTITWINNEFIYADEGTPLAGKAYTFRSAVENIKYLQEMGCDIVSLGNNHVFDFGAEGLASTIDVLDAESIAYTGAGRDLSDAMEPRYVIVNGKKIALVAATQVELTLSYTKQATADTPGVLKSLDPMLFVQTIEEARANSDYVIVYIHWGYEGILYPDTAQKELAQAFVDAGADMIIGSHSHRMQGLQYVDGVPVVNSLGNFWFSTGSLYTTVAQISVGEEGLSLSLLPCLQQNLTTSLITDEDTVKDFYRYVADLSSDVAITKDGQVGYYDGTNREGYEYFSGQYYRSHNPSFDLDGRSIDIVGNLD